MNVVCLAIHPFRCHLCQCHPYLKNWQICPYWNFPGHPRKEMLNFDVSSLFGNRKSPFSRYRLSQFWPPVDHAVTKGIDTSTCFYTPAVTPRYPYQYETIAFLLPWPKKCQNVESRCHFKISLQLQAIKIGTIIVSVGKSGRLVTEFHHCWVVIGRSYSLNLACVRLPAGSSESKIFRTIAFAKETTKRVLRKK
jgi:hypothetical protein